MGVFQAGVGIGQPKTWFSGRSTLTSRPGSFRRLHLEREARMDHRPLLGLAVGLAHHPAFCEAW